MRPAVTGALNPASLKLILGIACTLALAVLVNDRNRWKAAAGQRLEQVAAERAAHALTVAQYRAAAARARDADAANAARVRLAQASINERTADEFESRIAAARADARRLRRATGAAPADPGAGGAAPVPALPAAARGAAQAAGEGGLPHPDALTATEQAIQLDELIKWVEAQAAVQSGE